MEPWPGRPEVCKSVDLLAPEGYGEITGGSERMSDPDELVAAIFKAGANASPAELAQVIDEYSYVNRFGENEKEL